MAGELVSIPIQGGIDQSVSQALGEPRVWRLERARFVQPGEVVASPGYGNDPKTLPLTGSQTLSALGYSNVAGNWAIVSGTDASHYWRSYVLRRDPLAGWVSSSEYVSPAQAPRRHTITTNGGSNVPPQILRTTTPGLVIVVTNSTWLSYVVNGRVTREKALTYSPPGSPDDTTNFWSAGYCLVGSYGGVYKYDVATDTFTRVISYTPSLTISVWSDPEFGRPGSGTQYCAVVDTFGDINVYKWDGAAFSSLGQISSSDLPNVAPVGRVAGLVSCVFYQGQLVRFAGSGPVGTASAITLYGRVYTLPGLTPTGADATINIAFGSRPAQPAVDYQGNLWLAWQSYDGLNIPSVGLRGLTVDSGVIHQTTWFVMPGRMLAGRLIAAPGTSSGVLIQTQYGPDNDPAAELWRADGNAGSLVTALHGYQFYWACTGYKAGSALVYAAVNSTFDNKSTVALLMPGQAQLSQTVAPGTGTAGIRWTNEIVSIELGAAQPSSYALTSSISPIEAYAQAQDLVTGGLPVCIGNRLDSAGTLFTPPSPTATAIAGGSMAVGTYLYTVLLEIQDSQGRLTRSSPSNPVSVATAGGNLRVQIDFKADLPSIPGIDAISAQWIVYRTLVNGTAFHRIGPITGNTLTDSTVDSDLSSASNLYTQGATGGISGVLPSYGVPPCRCAWKGRDRMIVGGLEIPRRVRWSKLFNIQEGYAFPHPALAQYYYDLDDEVTAVAQLDDAWIVFCRTSIHAIYGIGPDDTGANGTFDPPRCVSRVFGCHSPRSLLETPEGILFQGQDGGVYLLTRGNLQVIWWSEKVRDLLGDVGTGLPQGWITAVVPHETRNTIHFVRDSQPPLVYDKRIQAWSLDTDWHSPGLIGAVTASVGRMPDATIGATNSTDENPTVFIGTRDGHLIFEGCNNGTTITHGPDGTVAWKPLLETSTISLFGLMGYGATQRISFLFGAGTVPIPYEDPFTLTIFNDVYRGDDVSESISIPHEFADATQYVTSVVAPPVIKASSIRLRVEWGKEAFVGFAFEIDQKPRTERTPPTVRA